MKSRIGGATGAMRYAETTHWKQRDGMRRNKLCLYIHFVWATYDRLPLITEDIERDLYHYITQVCVDDKCDVLSIGGMPDHLHLLVKFPNTLTTAKLMHDVKGGSSRFLTERLKPGEWFQWQGNYGVFSVSPKDHKKVIQYIRNQKLRHAENDLWPEIEETFELVEPSSEP